MYQVLPFEDYSYLIDLDTLEITKRSNIYLQSEIRYNPQKYINSFTVEDNGTYLPVENNYMISKYCDVWMDKFGLCDEMTFRINDEHFTVKIGESRLKIGDLDLGVYDHLVEDFFIMYAFIRYDLLCLRCLIYLDYDIPYYFTLLYDLVEEKFVKLLCDKDNNIFINGVEDNAFYMTKCMIHNDLREYVELNYELTDDY